MAVVIEGFRKSRGIGQFGENSCVGTFHALRHVDFTFSAVNKAHEKPKAWQDRDVSYHPRDIRYSSGGIFLGVCPIAHRFQSSISASRCSAAHSKVNALARRGR